MPTPTTIGFSLPVLGRGLQIGAGAPTGRVDHALVIFSRRSGGIPRYEARSGDARRLALPKAVALAPPVSAGEVRLPPKHGWFGKASRSPHRIVTTFDYGINLRCVARTFASRCSLAFIMAVLLASAQIMFASVTGSIAGRVTDPSGAVVPGATVTALNTQTGTKEATTTNEAGFYSFPTLSVGAYDIEVRATGFKTYRQTGLVLDVNSGLRVDAALEVGTVTEQVNVSATAVQVETASTQLGEVIGSTKMEAVPLNGRSYTDLLALQPGVVPVNAGTCTYPCSPAVSGNLNPGNLSINGQREDANSFMVNGGTVDESVTMGTAVIPNLDSIAEFRILTANFDAEYGNFSGGQINVITKSGTNHLHASAFEFLRNTDLDTRTFYDPTRGKFIQNQFGATLGGPIKRDRLFFFGDYQGTRHIVGASTGEIPVPSPADRNGNLADLAGQLTGTVTGSYWAGLLSQELGYPVSVGEAYYSPGCTTSSQCVFPNAIIPQSAFSSPAQPLMKYIPSPNVGPFFSTSAFNETLRDDKGGYRTDANTRWGMLSAYYFLDDYSLDNPYGGASLPGFDALNRGRAQTLSLSDVKSIGPKAVNEFRFQYMRDAYVGGLPRGGLGPTPGSLGFVEGPNTLGIAPDERFPGSIGVTGVGFNNFSIGVSSPEFHFNNIFQWLDNYSRVVGTHTLKFGGSINWNQLYRYIGSFNGAFGFSGVETGSDWADFLIGAPNFYYQGQFVTGHTRSRYYGLYAQDSWRARPNLTLNYGLRWQVNTPWYEVFNQVNAFVPGEQSVVFPGAPTGYVFPGDPGIPSTIAPTRYKNFAPRIGLAYSPSRSEGILGKLLGGAGKTSIRAGFGVFFTAFQGGSNFLEIGDAPFGYFYFSPTPPLFATPFVDRQTGNSEGQKFPVAFPPLGFSPSHPDTSVNWAKYLPISSSPAFFTGNRLPYAEHYNLTVQRQFGPNTLLSLSYLGTQGHRLLADLESNPGNPALCLSVSQPDEVAPGSPTCGPFAENGVYTTADGQTINGTRSPLGINFGANAYFAAMANSNYNSAQVSLRHTSGRTQFLVGYTYGKAMDNASGATGAGTSGQINVINQKLGKALSSFDVTHNFVASYSYELPFDKLGHANRFTSGWILTGITRFSTGLAVFLTEFDDRSLLGTCFNGIGTCVDTPNLVPGPLHITNPRQQDLATGANPYFNTSLFTPDNLGELGTANRRFFHGPGLNNFDMALLKNVRLAESKMLQFRVEFFNLFNHAQFGLPTGNINSSTFGFVTSAGPGRIGQLGLKLIF